MNIRILAISFFVICSFSIPIINGCSKQQVDITTPDDITIDPKHVGMVEGRVIIRNIENNEIVYKGYNGATVVLEEPEGEHIAKTTSITEGVYAFDNIPAGSYNVLSATCWVLTVPYSSWDRKPVVVEKQKTTTAGDLELVEYPILHGIIFYTDKTTPLANKHVDLYYFQDYDYEGNAKGQYMYSTTTSQDGRYAFKRYSTRISNWYPTKFFLKTPEGKLFFFDTEEEQSSHIENGSGGPFNIVQKNLYLAPS